MEINPVDKIIDFQAIAFHLVAINTTKLATFKISDGGPTDFEILRSKLRERVFYARSLRYLREGRNRLLNNCSRRQEWRVIPWR